MSLAQSREFILREQFFSMRNRVDIFSSYNEPIGYFESKPFQMRKRFWLRELDGDGLLAVVQRMGFTTTFDMYEAGPDIAPERNNPVGRLKQKFGLRPIFYFTSNNPMFDFEIEGNFWGMEFNIVSRGQIIAQISKSFWTFRDTYGVRIYANIPDLFAMSILTAVIVLYWDAEQAER